MNALNESGIWYSLSLCLNQIPLAMVQHLKKMRSKLDRYDVGYAPVVNLGPARFGGCCCSYIFGTPSQPSVRLVLIV